MREGKMAAVDVLARDLDRVFGPRLTALGTYAGHDSDHLVHTLAIVDRLDFRDLAACVPLADGWIRRGLAVPLMLSRDELRRTVDIFPLEYTNIIATLSLVRGTDPFQGLAPAREDVRRAIETQAKSHLIHLREGFLESRGEGQAIAALIAASAPPFRTLLASLARLTDPAAAGAPLHDAALAETTEARIGIPSTLIREIFAASAPGHSTIADPGALLSRYLQAAETVWQHVDEMVDTE